MKRIISVVCLLLVLSVSNTMSARATERQYITVDESEMCPEEIALREQLGITTSILQTDRSQIMVACGLKINSSGYATCSSSVSAGKDVKAIQIFLYLLKDSNKEIITSWMDQKEDYIFGMNRYHQLKERGTYIAKSSIYVAYTDGTYDNFIMYSHTDTY